MKTLLIYDSLGYILFQGQGSVREPNGVPFIWVVIPEGKRIKYTDGIGVDVNVTPNVAILEDIPLTEMEIMQKQLITSQQAIDMLVGMM
ncbi:hypothetical protein [Clostridium sp. CF012]|uniref:hypothetical protein n=1 Tax=Clostridium sp. CF012 TaxID=2843319 RepID=UPI001C0BBDFC|nr:hypothetical protein [Clostridium sp. CF012]MBU3146894.1 hypothetical protein [Clostridium sp. CF012]